MQHITQKKRFYINNFKCYLNKISPQMPKHVKRISKKNTTHIHTTAHPKYEHTQGNIQGNPYEPAKPKKTQSFRFSQKVLPKKEDGKKNKEGFRFASNI